LTLMGTKLAEDELKLAPSAVSKPSRVARAQIGNCACCGVAHHHGDARKVASVGVGSATRGVVPCATSLIVQGKRLGLHSSWLPGEAIPLVLRVDERQIQRQGWVSPAHHDDIDFVV